MKFHDLKRGLDYLELGLDLTGIVQIVAPLAAGEEPMLCDMAPMAQDFSAVT
jgi:hypothetical protein